MKANEVMIGDWVSCFNSTYQVEAINTIHPDEDVCLKYYGCEIADNISPIPLTAEMLEKNGFEFRLDCLHLPGYATIEKRGSGFLVRCRNYDFGNEVTICMKLYYAHELQHALRLCGLTELADNFKVE